MNIPKAIEILTDLNNNKRSARAPYGRAAIQLGIEALRQVREQRQFRDLIIGEKLPGETED